MTKRIYTHKEVEQNLGRTVHVDHLDGFYSDAVLIGLCGDQIEIVTTEDNSIMVPILGAKIFVEATK